MPKIVDHRSRRAEIAEAVWRVVLREGAGAASVRAVAAEAGWSTGALRHYFASQHDLLAFTVTSLIERVERRVAARAEAVVADGRPSGEDLVALLEEALPLDAERLAEAEVWLALVSAARTDPQLHPLTRDAHRGLRKLCRDVVSLTVGVVPDHEVLELETDLLHGLLDGLALHLTLYPDDISRSRARAAIRNQLTHLAGRATAEAQ